MLSLTSRQTRTIEKFPSGEMQETVLHPFLCESKSTRLEVSLKILETSIYATLLGQHEVGEIMACRAKINAYVRTLPSRKQLK